MRLTIEVVKYLVYKFRVLDEFFFIKVQGVNGLFPIYYSGCPHHPPLLHYLKQKQKVHSVVVLVTISSTMSCRQLMYSCNELYHE